MFGLGDNHQHNNDDPAMLDNVKQLVDDQASAASDTDDDINDTTSTTAVPSPDPTDDKSATSDSTDNSEPTAHAEPAQGFSSGPLPDDDKPADSTTEHPEPEDKQETPTPVEIASPSQLVETTTAPKTIEPANPHDLAKLKEQALGHLEPLMEHLGGSPEEVFKTTMMMIQANDNHKLIEKALEAAKKIEDDKVRAKAMLDIINEINYFSQNSKTN